jgi:hypothetical protein
MQRKKINGAICCSVVAFSLLMGLFYEKEAQAGPVVNLTGEVKLIYDGCVSGFPSNIPIDLVGERNLGQLYDNVVVYNNASSPLPYLYKGNYYNPDNVQVSAQDSSGITKLYINQVSKTVLIEYRSTSSGCGRYYYGVNLK